MKLQIRAQSDAIDKKNLKQSKSKAITMTADYVKQK